MTSTQAASADTTTATQTRHPHDIVGAGLACDDLVARAVSFRGSGHTLFDEPRQDAFALATHDDWLMAAVSDGVGSCENSHHGATAATQALVAGLESGELDIEDGAAVLEVAACAALAAAERIGVTSKSVSATLTVAAIRRASRADGSREAVIHAVGDSPALLLEPAEGRWTYLIDGGEGPSNVVRSWIPDRHDAFVSLGVVVPAGAVLVIASDGFTIPLGPGTGPLGADLAARWSTGPRDLFAFMVDLSFNAYHDDKTVVAVWNTAGGAEPAEVQLEQDTRPG